MLFCESMYVQVWIHVLSIVRFGITVIVTYTADMNGNKFRPRARCGIQLNWRKISKCIVISYERHIGLIFFVPDKA